MRKNKIMKMIVRVILIIIILIITLTIFSFSNQDAEESSSVSSKVAEILIKLQPKYKNITDSEKEELIEKYQTPVRKFAHFSIYTVLGMSIVGLTCTYEISNRKRELITIIAGALYAMSDEIHQTFIEGRSGQVTDVLLDTFGVIVGTILVLGIIKILKNKRTKEA